ncbi:hypothetical protein OGAPHI_001015 [Ogataea philodendri]|uniref:Uncharacterized protein n=1 Tax=Ogataea philodendri TaxID=1378263 RepID=A0A9P8PF55_9ASCO|nr:uncharacterized protein OGAPHI_001015 [Ogataea philodendri]KAH3670500.1 hypothetical protein OGAPHI_001015 [Ogataea philodendri]
MVSRLVSWSRSSVCSISELSWPRSWSLRLTLKSLRISDSGLTNDSAIDRDRPRPSLLRSRRSPLFRLPVTDWLYVSYSALRSFWVGPAAEADANKHDGASTEPIESRLDEMDDAREMDENTLEDGDGGEPEALCRSNSSGSLRLNNDDGANEYVNELQRAQVGVLGGTVFGSFELGERQQRGEVEVEAVQGELLHVAVHQPHGQLHDLRAQGRQLRVAGAQVQVELEVVVVRLELVDGCFVLLAHDRLEVVPGVELGVQRKQVGLGQAHEVVWNNIEQLNELDGDVEVLGGQLNAFQWSWAAQVFSDLDVEEDLKQLGERVQAPVESESVDFLCLGELGLEAELVRVGVEREDSTEKHTHVQDVSEQRHGRLLVLFDVVVLELEQVVHHEQDDLELVQRWVHDKVDVAEQETEVFVVDELDGLLELVGRLFVEHRRLGGGAW